MVDIALAENFTAVDRAVVVAKGGRRDAWFRLLTQLAALIVVILFVGILTSLTLGAMPSIKQFGFSFLTHAE